MDEVSPAVYDGERIVLSSEPSNFVEAVPFLTAVQRTLKLIRIRGGYAGHAGVATRWLGPLVRPGTSRHAGSTERVQDCPVGHAEVFRDRCQGLAGLVHRGRGGYVAVGQDPVAGLDAGPLQDGEDGRPVDVEGVGQSVGGLACQ